MKMKARYVNYKREFPEAANHCWRAWFAVHRYWGGKIINIHVRHHCIVLDFRRDWVRDMITGKP